MDATQRGPSSNRRMSPDEALSLWRRYRETGDGRLRDRLILTFAPLVKHLAYKRVRELPAEIGVEDLISAGLEALIASIDRYDPDRGATLEQFAWTRIHGALVDELRKRDWAPRSLRRFQREAKRAAEQFGAIHGRPPQPHELADALGMSLEQLRDRQHKLQTSEIRSLNEAVSDAEAGDIELVETLPSTEASTNPFDVVAAKERQGRFRRAIERLPERDRQVAVLRYVQELTLAEIGEILGVSESRVSQLDTQLKKRLRAELEGTIVEPRAA